MDFIPVAEVHLHIFRFLGGPIGTTFLLCQSVVLEEALVVILAYKCDFHSAECASFGAGERADTFVY